MLLEQILLGQMLLEQMLLNNSQNKCCSNNVVRTTHVVKTIVVSTNGIRMVLDIWLFEQM